MGWTSLNGRTIRPTTGYKTPSRAELEQERIKEWLPDNAETHTFQEAKAALKVTDRALRMAENAIGVRCKRFERVCLDKVNATANEWLRRAWGCST